MGIVNYKQIGNTGLKRYGPYIYEEFLPELRWPRAAKVYREMADNDPVIGAILYLAEMLIRGTSWSVKPASDKKEDVEAAEFLKTCLYDMEFSWDNTICEILSMLTYGFSFHEVVYKIRRGPDERNPKYRSQYTDCRIGWRKIPIRAQHSLHSWKFNEETNEVIAFIQQCEPKFDIVEIPVSGGLLFRTKISNDNPEGRSLLRNAYRPWFFKKHFEEIEGIGIERDLAGLPTLTPPDGIDIWNKDDPNMVHLLTKAQELVSSVRRDSEEGLIIPNGWQLELLSSPSSRQINIGDTIDRYDNRIAITMLSDIILIGGNKTGSFALADSKQSMLGAALQAQLENIADVFNSKAVPMLFGVNNFVGITRFPVIEPGRIQTPSIKELALMLRAMGLKIAGDMPLMGYLRHILGLPDLDVDTFNEVYKPQMKGKETNDTGTNTGEHKQDDTAENDFEQNDQAYTGGK